MRGLSCLARCLISTRPVPARGQRCKPRAARYSPAFRRASLICSVQFGFSALSIAIAPQNARLAATRAMEATVRVRPMVFSPPRGNRTDVLDGQHRAASRRRNEITIGCWSISVAGTTLQGRLVRSNRYLRTASITRPLAPVTVCHACASPPSARQRIRYMHRASDNGSMRRQYGD